jgi:hypothetical protein
MKTKKQLLSMLGIVTMITAAPSASAQSGGLVPGTYRCSSYNVSGGGGSCRTAQPLVLSPDGSYRYSSTVGHWTVDQGRLLLSRSTLWGPGEILGSQAIRFAYDYRGWRHTVTWTCGECSPAVDPEEEGGHAAPGSYAGVSLTLEFDTDIGGVSGFTIVPVESALEYTHNAPLPVGSVQGLAWDTSSTTVDIATNRDNQLMSGKRYVVFLSWPRETIPVAILDLPPASGDYAATLPATLDGSSVLTRLGG